MPPLDTMMPCELLPSRSVDFSLILCGVVRDTTAREATAREAAARGTTARKAAGATARGVAARIAVVRGVIVRNICLCECYNSDRFGTIHAIRSPNRTIRTRYRNKNDSSNDSYRGVVESFRIVRFVS